LLDTVLVVEKAKQWNSKDNLRDVDERLSEPFHRAVSDLLPLTHGERRLVRGRPRGATNGSGPFSFVPVLPLGNPPKGFARPDISGILRGQLIVTSTGKNPGLSAQNLTVCEPVQGQNTQSVWRAIAQYVLQGKLQLGVEFTFPC